MRPRPGRNVVLLNLAACVLVAGVAGNALALGFGWFGAVSVLVACLNGLLVALRVW